MTSNAKARAPRREMRECAVCPEKFEVRPDNNGDSKQTCSVGCRMAMSRARTRLPKYRNSTRRASKIPTLSEAEKYGVTTLEGFWAVTGTGPYSK